MIPSQVRILEAVDQEYVEDARQLFHEYALALDSEVVAGTMTDELVNLPGAYAPPAGSLMVAYVGGEPAGVLGLAPVPVHARLADVDVIRSGELKRLFVRPEFRRHGVGAALMLWAEGEARARGYDSLLLTTNADIMPLAQNLYDSLGYVEWMPYRVLPRLPIRWMRKDLVDGEIPLRVY